LASRYGWCTPDAFLDLTLRQVTGLLKVINRSELARIYTEILSYRASRAKELPSFDEFLAVTLKESPTKENVFDEKADKALEAYALKRLEERRKNG